MGVFKGHNLCQAAYLLPPVNNSDEFFQVGKATEGVRTRMSFRQRRLNDDNATEYTDIYIQVTK